MDESSPVMTSVQAIVDTPEQSANTSVSLTGKITSQCGSGCWFIISDESGDLYVNLKPNNFIIPPVMGKQITVNGTVQNKDNDVYLIGTDVLLDNTHYPQKKV